MGKSRSPSWFNEVVEVGVGGIKDGLGHLVYTMRCWDELDDVPV